MRFQPAIAAGHGGSAVDLDILAAEKLAPGNSLEAISKYLMAAKSALVELRQQPSNAAALNDYNFALGRVFSVIRDKNIDVWSKPFLVSGYIITYRKDARALWNPADYDFIPCDELSVGGTGFTKPAHRNGLGATLVASRRTPVEDFRKQFLNSPHFFYGVTAIASFEGGRCEIAFEDPLAKQTVDLKGYDYPLAGDFSSAIAIMLVREKPEKLGFSRMVYPDKYADTRLLFRLQPYDPKKIPIIFVHGLQDSAVTWADMFNDLLRDPQLRSAYQFWFFSYPSGEPFPYSAAFLRKDLDALDKAFPDHKPIVMVGHSMGGLITRLMVTDSGRGIWKAMFKKSPGEIDLPLQDRRLLESAMIFQHRKDISLAVFMSTPHRGAALAANWIGAIGKRLIHLPRGLLEVGTALSYEAVTDRTIGLTRIPTSIETLAPTSPFITALNRQPVSSSIPFCQIIGDRGRGDTPSSSDGVVAYWSSHLDGARSTRIVPSGHGTHHNPEGIAELHRILKDHIDTTSDLATR